MCVNPRVLGAAAFLACLAVGCDAGPVKPPQAAAKGDKAAKVDKAVKADKSAPAEKVVKAEPASAPPEAKGESRVVTIKPGPDVEKETVTKLIKAKPGDVIEFDEGTFHFTKGLSLTVDGVTIRGKGMDKTILSFKGQDEGKQGLIVNRDNFVLADLTIQDTAGNATRLENADHVTYRNVKTEWTGEPKATNGAYGVYPVQCKNVLVEGCVAIAASDAGIYVGQSTNVVVRKCRAERCVAGIEIENCVNADVYDNVATDNAGGLLVFDLPDLQLKNGGNVSVHDNQVFNNNHANFAAPGNMVADVAPGTGVMVMATDHVELFKNKIKDNQSYGLLVISYKTTGRPIEDKAYDPYPEAVYAHENTFEGNGKKPTGKRAEPLAALLGTPMPEIIYDGWVNPKKLVDGKLPDDQRIVFRDNGPVSVVNLHWNEESLKDMAAAKEKIERNPKSLEGELPALPPVKLSEVK